MVKWRGAGVMARMGLWALALGAVLLVVGSFLGFVHPLGDSLAVLRWQLALVAGVLGAILWAMGARHGRLLVLGALLVCAPLGVAALWPQTAQTPGMLLIYQKNLNYRIVDTAPLIEDIRAAAPDALMLQELSQANADILPALVDTLPHQHACPFNRIGAVGIATRLTPVADVVPLCLEKDGLAGLLVEGPNRPIWLISTHFHWPWPHGQAEQVARLLPVLEALDAPIILAGDYNMVPWGHSVGQVRRATGTEPLGPLRNTFRQLGPALPLPIDDIYVPKGSQGGTALRPLLLSDHFGLLGWVTLPE